MREMRGSSAGEGLLERALATVLGVPYDASSSFERGSALGPKAIRAALFSPASNLWSETGLDIGRADLLGDAGDLDLGQRPEEARAIIEDAVYRLCVAGTRPLLLGGDHSITYPALRGLSRCHRPLTVLQLDAHPDLYDELDGDRFSHGCPFARISEEGLAARLVQVGIRAMTGHQREQAVRFGVEVIEARASGAAGQLRIDGPVWVSIDIDAFDPAFAPGVSHPESGGLTPRDVFALLQDLEAEIVGADIVELNPGRDLAGITAVLAAKLVKETVAAMAGGILAADSPPR